MKPTDDMHKLIKKMQIKTSAELDRRVHDDISKALAKSEPAISRFITKGGVMKLAVAAAVIIAFGIGYFTGQRSNQAQSETYSLDVTGYTPAVSAYPDSPKSENGFWRQKAFAAMQPRPYAQSQFDKTSLIDAYKQYLKEKHYD